MYINAKQKLDLSIQARNKYRIKNPDKKQLDLSKPNPTQK